MVFWFNPTHLVEKEKFHVGPLLTEMFFAIMHILRRKQKILKKTTKFGL
jgi:hypothetical protein